MLVVMRRSFETSAKFGVWIFVIREIRSSKVALSLAGRGPSVCQSADHSIRLHAFLFRTRKNIAEYRKMDIVKRAMWKQNRGVM